MDKGTEKYYTKIWIRGINKEVLTRNLEEKQSEIIENQICVFTTALPSFRYFCVIPNYIQGVVLKNNKSTAMNQYYLI